MGYWDSLDDIRSNWAIDKVFTPSMEEQKRIEKLKGWHRAVRCALAWADDEGD